MSAPKSVTIKFSHLEDGDWLATVSTGNPAEPAFAMERGPTMGAAAARVEALMQNRPLMPFTDEMPAMKQVIIIRKDLNMRRGKEISQGAHASSEVVARNLLDPRMHMWRSQGMAKITVSVESEEELLDLEAKAKAAGLLSFLVTDHGRTEFGGVHTRTSLAIGPDLVELIDPITRDLKLR